MAREVPESITSYLGQVREAMLARVEAVDACLSEMRGGTARWKTPMTKYLVEEASFLEDMAEKHDEVMAQYGLRFLVKDQAQTGAQHSSQPAARAPASPAPRMPPGQAIDAPAPTATTPPPKGARELPEPAKQMAALLQASAAAGGRAALRPSAGPRGPPARGSGGGGQELEALLRKRQEGRDEVASETVGTGGAAHE